VKTETYISKSTPSKFVLPICIECDYIELFI